MGKYGNSKKIIDADNEQSDIVKREGVCLHCRTVVKTALHKHDDSKRFYFSEIPACATISCPICIHAITMRQV